MFGGGPLDGLEMADVEEEPDGGVELNLPRYVFLATRHGRVGASFDIFNPAELATSLPPNRNVHLHQYRIVQRSIADDATIQIQAGHVGPTGRVLRPTPQAIAAWARCGARRAPFSMES
jgi:hypothetical protein